MNFRVIKIARNLIKRATMATEAKIDVQSVSKEIREGEAKISTQGNVFYNPVQEFNRDLSISAITAFDRLYADDRRQLQQKHNNRQNNSEELDSNLVILEALSATGLRSIRYAKEIPNVKKIVANDISRKAVDDIRRNIVDNGVDKIVEPSQNDATMLMYQHRYDKRLFDVIDLDPYGCPSIFLDSALQAVKDGGLLLITATDMAVLAGNAPETCYSKYGAISLKLKSCHEMAIRILLQCIESHANRYSRYIEPLLSISVDFYIRVFVRVHTSASKCKFTLSKLSNVFHCTGCDSFELRPLGVVKYTEKNPNQPKFALPTGLPVDSRCQHCLHPFHMGGPIWNAPIHNKTFVQEVLNTAKPTLGTYKRIEGVLNVILEELDDVPLYYTLERLCGGIHVETPPMMQIRSAILNAGHRVSYTHMHKTSIKTDAPSRLLWDIMRSWAKSRPASKRRLTEDSPAKNILDQAIQSEISFEAHPDANPASKKMGLVRFQENPQAYWGPGTRATAMTGPEKMDKSRRKQGKRKRINSEEGGDTS